MRFEFEVHGDKLVSRKLVRFGNRAIDAAPAFRLIADDMRHYETERFDSAGNGTWAPLEASTIAQKARKGLDPRILHATERLRRSLTSDHAPDQELIITPAFMVFGSKVPYAQFHQKGEGVPTRKPLGFTEGQKRQILRRLQAHVIHETR